MNHLFGYTHFILISVKGRSYRTTIRNEQEKIVCGTHEIYCIGESRISDEQRIEFYNRAQGYVKQTLDLLDEAGEFDDPVLLLMSVVMRRNPQGVHDKLGDVRLERKKRMAA